MRVAIVGTGDWWGLQHARAFAEREDADVVAIVGRTADRTRQRAAAYGAHPYLSLEKMLEDERPDLVSVCLPNEEHFATLLALIHADVAIFTEKPLVFSLEEADLLINEAAARRVFFAIDFNHRWATPVRMASEALAQGRAGNPILATWRFGGEGRSSHPYANLIETQCHGFDMLEHLVGPVESVMAQMTDPADGTHPTVAVALRFVNGAVGSLVGSYEASYAHPDAQRLEVSGSRGRLVIHDTVRRYEFQSLGSEVGEVWEAGYFNDLDREFHHTLDRHLDSVLAALRGGEEPPVHARAGRRALALAHSVIHSFESGHRVPVAPDAQATTSTTAWPTASAF